VDNIIEQLKPLAVDIKTVKLDKKNTRMGHDLSQLVVSLTKYGQRKPIVVNKTTMVIEAGNGTYQAAKKAGWDKVAAVFVEDDDHTALGYSIADNRLAELSEWNDSQLMESLTHLGDDFFLVDDLDDWRDTFNDADSKTMKAQAKRIRKNRVLSIENVVLPKYAVRAMSPNEYKRLVESIRRVGILEQLKVRKIDGGRYEIFDGRQRYKAALELGIEKLECRIYQFDNEADYVAACIASGAVIGKTIGKLMGEAIEQLGGDPDFEKASGMSKDRMEAYKYTSNYDTIETDGVLERDLRTTMVETLETIGDEFQTLMIPLTPDQFTTISMVTAKSGKELPETLHDLCKAYLESE